MVTSTMAKMPSPPRQSRTNSPNKQQNQTDSTKTDTNNDLQLTLSQPRYLTSEILQQFLNINHWYCHKIIIIIKEFTCYKLPLDVQTL
jgi:hypothetical protein